MNEKTVKLTTEKTPLNQGVHCKNLKKSRSRALMNWIKIAYILIIYSNYIQEATSWSSKNLGRMLELLLQHRVLFA